MGGSGREGQQCCPPCSPPALYFGHAGRYCGGGGACRSAGQQRRASKNCPPAPCPPLCLSLSRRAGALLCIPLPSSSQPCRFDPAPPIPSGRGQDPPTAACQKNWAGFLLPRAPPLQSTLSPLLQPLYRPLCPCPRRDLSFSPCHVSPHSQSLPVFPPLQGERGLKGMEGDKGDKGEQGMPGEKVWGWGGSCRARGC